MASITFLLVIFVISISISTADLIMYPVSLQQLNLTGELSLHATDIETASLDFGGISHVKPLAVLHPSSVEDIVSLIKAAYDAAESSQAFTVSARGNGHSLNGQAQTGNGVVIDMRALKSSHRFRVSKPVLGALNTKGEEKLKYVDVWGGDLWIDVLKWTLKYGLAPKSWTDYLHLTVGGTLSNAGISGQAYIHGPQISNVYELDVVTGKGEVLICSETKNSELFHGVLGGLGQFGIITRARIALEQAPQMVRWIRVLYSNFSAFTGDQENLISLHGKPSSEKFDYVEGFVIVDPVQVNNWRTSYASPRDLNISSLATDDGLLYCMEIAKNYDESTADVVDQEIESLLKKLNFIPSSVFTNDVSYLDFLDRVHKEELKLRNQDLWDVPHPWLILTIPKSRIADFANGVFKGFLGNKTVGPIIIYPLNRDKWDDRSSAVIPDENMFYQVGLLRSASDASEENYLSAQNRLILKFCDELGIKVKQYLGYYKTQEEWEKHFGDKWKLFCKRKSEFDPKFILATGQQIFQPIFDSPSNIPT